MCDNVVDVVVPDLLYLLTGEGNEFASVLLESSRSSPDPTLLIINSLGTMLRSESSLLP